MHHLTAALTLLSLAAFASPTRPNAGEDFSSPEKIQAHLARVEARLRAVDVSHLEPVFQRRRVQLLDALHTYRERGQFPHNHDFPGQQTPYFLDEHGTACAVAQLVIESGHRALAEKIQATKNNQYLLEMNDPQLSRWVAQSGFTAEELAAIQPAYPDIDTPFGFALRYTSGGAVSAVVIPGVRRSSFGGGTQSYQAVVEVSKDEIWFASPAVTSVRRNGVFTSDMQLQLVDLQSSPAAGVWGLSHSGLHHLEGGVWRLTQGSMLSPSALWIAGKDDLWIAGGGGEIHHFNGSTFTVTSTGTTAHIHALWGSSPTQIFAAGDGGLLLQWDGTQWSKVTSPTTNDLRGLSGSGPNDVLAVGAKGTMLSFDGTGWSTKSLGLTAHLYDVSVSGSRAFAVGDEGTVLERGADGVWSALESNTRTRLTDVSIGAEEVWITIDGHTCGASDPACKYDPPARGCESIPAESLLALFALLFALRPLAKHR